MTYDNYGRQISLTDPNAGMVSYQYNNFGELVKQIDALGNADSLSYDVLGRVHTRTREEGTTTYAYDPSGKPGLLSSVTYPGGSVSYTYDTYSKLQNKTIVINSSNYSTSYTYDSYSRLETQTYPSGFAIKNIYNTFGYLDQVRRNDNNALIWECESVNTFGEVTQQKYGNNLTTVKEYDVLGMLRSITTGNVQDLSYSFNYATGNLESRKDNLRDLEELFSYDNLGRLTQVSGPAALAMSYASNGNIQSKTLVGNYSYGTKPHSVTSVTNPNGLIPSTEQRVTYTTFNKTDSIIQANYLNVFTYGHEDQRTISRFYDNEVLKKTTYYAGDYEEEVIPGQSVRKLHYIAGGDGLAAIFVKNGENDTMYYMHTDHLGSFDVITDQSGTVVQNYSFDVWGRRRNHTDWTYTSVPTGYLFARGFTGHEHLDQFALVNMNGRMYDPLLARFLAPDNYVQAPDFSQSFNRYSYCLNNPLMFVDPTGYSWLSNFGDWLGKIGRAVVTTVVSITVTAVIAAVLVSTGGAAGVAAAFLGGMAGGFAGGVTGAALNGGDFIDCMGAGMKGMFMAAATMGVLQGIGGIPLNPLGKGWSVPGGIATKADVSVWANNIFGNGTGRSIINGVSNRLLAGGGASAAAGGIFGGIIPLSGYDPNTLMAGPGGTSGQGGYSIDDAVNYLNSHAYSPDGPHKYGTGSCSPFVSNAINAGFGDNRIPTNLAGSAYGPSLLNAGFTFVPIKSLANYTPLKGDIAVMNGPPGGRTCNTGVGGPCGHIQMYNGNQWVSDFFQTRPFWPGPTYENTKPQLYFQIYRW